MTRRTIGSLVLTLLAGTCVALGAEPTKTITLKVYDGKSMKPVVPTGYQVRVDHLTELHPDWVKQNDDGTEELTIPADTAVIAFHLAYDNSMELYKNCDAEKSAFGDVWYTVSEIMKKGLVAANGCAKAKVNEKYKTTAVPGELILFVREMNIKERATE
jgi:hypothetical protein